jgi:hypothetical protein
MIDDLPEDGDEPILNVSGYSQPEVLIDLPGADHPVAALSTRGMW